MPAFSAGEAGDQDLEPLPLRLRQELVIFPGRVIFGVLTGHLHVAAERNDADAVLGVAALHFQNLRAEAEREGQHAHAVPAGEQEVAKLVNEHEHAEHEQKCKKRRQSLSLIYLILARSPALPRANGPTCRRGERLQVSPPARARGHPWPAQSRAGFA
jgi:hypothetical protein